MPCISSGSTASQAATTYSSFFSSSFSCCRAKTQPSGKSNKTSTLPDALRQTECHRVKGQKGQSRRSCPRLAWLGPPGSALVALPTRSSSSSSSNVWQCSELPLSVPTLRMFKCQLVYSVATLLSAHCSRRRTAACAALGVRFKVPACDMS